MKNTHPLFTIVFACIVFFTGCKRDEVTVTFEPNGGDGTIVTQKFTQKTAQPLMENTFTYNGFAFQNWNTTPDGTGIKYRDQETIKISEDMVLYAQWIPFSGTYFITFNANGGTGTMERQLFIGFETKELTANAFTRANYFFTSWNTKADGTGTRYRNKAEITPRTHMELNAQWAKNPEPCPGVPTVNDIDGNTYNTVQIGSQCWMRENLRTTKLNTGIDIPVITDSWAWYINTAKAMCYYNNDETNADKYGALYNGYAVYNTESLCPQGWRVPSNESWNKLANFLGGAEVAGYKMKTFDGWDDSWDEDGNGSNESGFSALPAGYRWPSYFNNMGSTTVFWSASMNGSYGRAQSLHSNGTNLDSYNYVEKNNGLSVRCIKN